MTKCIAKRPTFFGMLCGAEVYRDEHGNWYHVDGYKNSYDHSAKPENNWDKLPTEIKNKLINEIHFQSRENQKELQP